MLRIKLLFCHLASFCSTCRFYPRLLKHLPELLRVALGYSRFTMCKQKDYKDPTQDLLHAMRLPYR